MQQIFVPLLLIISAAMILVAGSSQGLDVGIFSELQPGGVPQGWDPLHFSNVKEETDYALSNEDGRVVLRAESRMSASALLKKVDIDPTEFPYLRWSWKTDGSCFSGSWRQPENDDFPLRLFVLFEKSGGLFSFLKNLGSDFSGNTVLYLRGTISPEDETSSYLSDRIKIVPLDAARERTREWTRHVRNVRDDYRELFDKEPNRIKALAVMTDTDNSRTKCVSYFGDIYFSEQK